MDAIVILTRVVLFIHFDSCVIGEPMLFVTSTNKPTCVVSDAFPQPTINVPVLAKRTLFFFVDLRCNSSCSDERA